MHYFKFKIDYGKRNRCERNNLKKVQKKVEKHQKNWLTYGQLIVYNVERVFGGRGFCALFVRPTNADRSPAKRRLLLGRISRLEIL